MGFAKPKIRFDAVILSRVLCDSGSMHFASAVVVAIAFARRSQHITASTCHAEKRSDEASQHTIGPYLPKEAYRDTLRFTMEVWASLIKMMAKCCRRCGSYMCNYRVDFECLAVVGENTVAHLFGFTGGRPSKSERK